MVQQNKTLHPSTPEITPLFNLARRYLDRRCQVFEDDYKRAKSELRGELAPFLDKPLASAIIGMWEKAVELLKEDAGQDAELVWLEVYPQGSIQPMYHFPNQEK